MRRHYVIVEVREPDDARPGSHVGLVRKAIHELDSSEGGFLNLADFTLREDQRSYHWDSHDSGEAARDYSVVREIFGRVSTSARRASMRWHSARRTSSSTNDKHQERRWSVKFNRQDLLRKVECYFDDERERQIHDRDARIGDWNEAFVQWREEKLPKLASVVRTLSDKLAHDEVITVDDLRPLRWDSLGFTNVPRPTLLDPSQVKYDPHVLRLQKFLNERDDEYLTSTALENLGFTTALRQVHSRRV
jgi:hypothetical protein